MPQKNFYITTTLPYVNAPLHMGHALEFARADAVARYKKLAGYEVFFNTGTDEHGLKIFERAQDEGMSPQAFVDEGFSKFKEAVKMFGLLDGTGRPELHFIRTTEERHIRAAQEFWRRCRENKDEEGRPYIYKKNYTAKYCVGCEEEKTESELVKGECLIHPGRPLEVIQEENYFFRYSALEKKLKDFYQKHPDFIIPDFRFNEVKQFVERGLRDFSISRLKVKMPWGVPVPDDPEHVMYVWFDALTNYISTLGWPEDKKGLFAKFWPERRDGEEGRVVQYCGKDNTRFQGAMWQAMLMAAGVPNSHQIVVDGFIIGQGGVKMSKTLGNVVDPKEIVAEYGTDALRYFLLGEIASFEDSPFTLERFKEAYNAKLANGLGNLVSRILTLSEKYLKKCPEIPKDSIPREFFNYFEKFDIQKATEYLWQKIQNLDKRIQEEEPFKVVKTNAEKGEEIIKELVLELYTVARMLNPLLPETNTRLEKLIRENKKPIAPLFPRKD